MTRLIIILLLLCHPASQAMAEGSIGVVYATGISPYKNYDSRHIAMPWLHYENEYIYLRGTSLGIKIYDKNSLELSAYVAYDPQRFKSKDSNDGQLRLLDDRSDSFIAGGRASLNHQVGIFSASLGSDISGKSGGVVGQVSYAKPFDFDRFNLTPAVGLYWASEKYNDYYFGVSKKESLKSALPVYRADAAFSPFASIKADISLDEEGHWGIFAHSEIIFLAPTIKDSPMVNRSTTSAFVTGVRYSF